MKTLLESVYEHERTRADEIWFTQPMGGGVLRDLTFAEAMAEARGMAAHLRSLGLPAGSRIAIFSKNTAWWFLSDLAIWMAGHVSVPVYPTLAATSIRQILEHSGARVIFIGKLDGFAAMAPGIPDGIDRILLPLAPSTRGLAWDAIIAKTAPLRESPAPAPDALATIIYTSGSTGVPKGVSHTFRTMGSARILAEEIGLRPDDRVISYLPLSHIAERACIESTNFIVGFRVYFAESLDTFVADIRRARPTVFGSVPRLWLKFQSGVFAKMPPAKLERLKRIPIVGRLVRRKVLAGLGFDQVRLAVSGSAPIPAELLDWYRDLGIDIREIYAMTENFAVSHMVRKNDLKAGYVGRPVAGVSQRISDVGEVLVKSPGLMTGYYNAPELTAETIDSEGWLHTGDRGELDGEGRLRITGRVKELFKTSKGKYVSPAPIENLLLAHPEIDQACVTGAGLPQPVALVVLSAAARAKGDGSALAHALDQINAQLDPHEQLDRLIVLRDEWTSENGLLTPTLKLKRGAIEDRYLPKMEGWASGRETVVFAE